jgi:hypothetical protein
MPVDANEETMPVGCKKSENIKRNPKLKSEENEYGLTADQEKRVLVCNAALVTCLANELYP